MKIAKSKIKNFRRLLLLILAIIFLAVAGTFALSYFAEEELKKEMIDESIDPEQELLRELEENP